jgi:hypothetical protein
MITGSYFHVKTYVVFMELLSAIFKLLLIICCPKKCNVVTTKKENVDARTVFNFWF